MKKTYCVVDGSNRATIAKWKIGRRGQVYFDERPEKRIKVIIGYFGIDCTMVGFVLVCLGFLRATWQPAPITIVLSCMLFPCGCFCLLVDKLAGENGNGTPRNKHFGSWEDPHHLAQGKTTDVPGKKTYYVVDSERNAVVDVIHLGKWGQKWLNRHATRQATKIGE